jgi:hypothetical protein
VKGLYAKGGEKAPGHLIGEAVGSTVTVDRSQRVAAADEAALEPAHSVALQAGP